MGKEDFDIIIGADGQYSGVRRLVFGEDENFLKKFHVQFCVFSIPNIFNLNFSEIVYFNRGKLVTAYAALENSYASFAFKSTKQYLPSTNLTEVFDKEFQNLGWQTPLLNSLMKKSKDIYFGSIAQVKMDSWFKGRVTLIGDAAHSVQGMGTKSCYDWSLCFSRAIRASKWKLFPCF
jgi:2-polyprenyl-6-methoxyphenol hydroxylase-like FAD-dependent oxidoreductase